MRRPLLLVATVLALSGCGGEVDSPTFAPAAAQSSSTTSSAPAATSTAGAERVVPVALYTHCGIRTATFEGRKWEAIGPIRYSQKPGDDLGGTMTVLGPDLIRFDITDPDAPPVPGGVLFRPAVGEGPPPCD